ncbi:POT family proton-dependent oligopeptide transporter [Fusarium oxysporum f. sp. lycopersici 4287]|uniref:POT family proton-dependent oligopeptide transporter n=1 Tax=Fusarium oxysporum f. sp. lycopersici (strain 4287 / CBS 123668 / FGSC 9935 / NRRL 34936) TaxID=426428 RepID=A0A0J9UAP2_FUSO4|nr:POT family proton-dependent oligopeptide transporter [Fusarium oxysporum f. sp. lycopersici 4287]KNA96363.1 POT family proton-dependent oligopeptide transporter [Fusarium oxysporum f. sp. lycopersici 4287]
MAPAGDSLAEPITVAGLRAEVLDEKRASISAEKRASIATDPRPATADAGAVTPAGVVTPDGQFPTAEELDTLRRVPNKIPMKLFSIAFIELCERFSYYGCTVVFTNFIQQKLPEGSTTGADPEQPGALGMGQRASTGITTFNQFWQYFMPLLGAYIADQYWGRYKTISWALGIDIIGHIILIMSAIPPVIGNQGGALGAMIIAIIVIGFGTGGFKPNVNPLIVEQLGEQYMHVKTLKSGERVIVDPAVTIERVYLWFYFCINVGALVGQVTMVFAEKEIGFWLSYTLPTFMLCLCPLVMWLNRHKYERRPPGGSVLGQALKTWFLAQKGCWSINPVATWKNLHKDDFWEKVKPSNFSHETRPKWMTFDDAWVDELSRGFNACAVFCWYPIFWLCYNQINNNLISQAAVMQRHGVPNDILSNLNPFALLIFIPLNDFFIYPALRKAGFRFTPIKKITAGFFTGAAAMIWAAVVQHYIYQKSECGKYASGEDCAAVEINVWAQTGSYVLIALSEVFASITSLEYAFSKAPKNMRSMVQAVALFMTAFSAALGQALVGLAADPLLVWNYGVVAINSPSGQYQLPST